MQEIRWFPQEVRPSGPSFQFLGRSILEPKVALLSHQRSYSDAAERASELAISENNSHSVVTEHTKYALIQQDMYRKIPTIHPGDLLRMARG